MVRSCFGKIKDIKLAAQQTVAIFSRTKRPRHIDRAGVALSRLSRRYKSQWFPRQEVLRTVLRMHEKSGDPKAIGALIKPYVEDSLPALANAGYIAIDERNQTLRIRKRAVRMMNDIYKEIQDADFKTALEKYLAHCDVYRQRIGNGSDKTKKELITEIKAIFEANALLKAKLAEALSRHDLREHMDPPSQSSDGDIDMDDTPIAGPSTPYPNPTINITPLPQKMSVNPEAAYPTPTSPQRPHGNFIFSSSPPPSPSPLSRQPTLPCQDDSRMNVDDDKIDFKSPRAPVDESPAGNWGFGSYLRNLASVLSSSVGSRKHPGADNQALGQELRQKVTTESGNHRELVTSLNDCKYSLEMANSTIVTQKEQLREKDALLATSAEETLRLNQNLDMERSRRENAEADVEKMQRQYQVALRANTALRAESVIIKNKLFHSELGRKALVVRVAKLEKKLKKMDTDYDEEIQLWVAQVNDLKRQIIADESKAHALSEDWKRREYELQREVDSRLRSFQEYQETFNQFFNIMDGKRHLWPSST